MLRKRIKAILKQSTTNSIASNTRARSIKKKSQPTDDHQERFLNSLIISV